MTAKKGTTKKAAAQKAAPVSDYFSKFENGKVAEYPICKKPGFVYIEKSNGEVEILNLKVCPLDISQTIEGITHG